MKTRTTTSSSHPTGRYLPKGNAISVSGEPCVGTFTAVSFSHDKETPECLSVDKWI